MVRIIQIRKQLDFWYIQVKLRVRWLWRKSIGIKDIFLILKWQSVFKIFSMLPRTKDIDTRRNYLCLFLLYFLNLVTDVSDFTSKFVDACASRSPLSGTRDSRIRYICFARTTLRIRQILNCDRTGDFIFFFIHNE